MLMARRDARAQEVDDLTRRSARSEHRRDALNLQLVRVVRRDRPADDHEHVVDAVLLQPVEDPRHERHVRTGQDRDADRVRILLDRRLHDLLRRLVQTRVDHLHAGVSQRPRDDLRAPVVAVETGLRDHHSDLPGHGVGSIRRCV
jgi:hypothetical protein